MKTCSRCGNLKSLDSFATRNTTKNTYQSWCRQCFTDYDRERYHDGDKERKDRNKQAIFERAQEIVWNALDSGCLVCGESDKMVLEFDHRDPSEKETNISILIRCSNLTKLNNELSKCDVLCANCHRRKTASQFGNWKYQRYVG